MRAENFHRGFFVLFLAAVSFIFLWMIRDFLLTLFLAAIFTGMAAPLYQWFLRKLVGRRGLASLLTLLALLFMVGIPLFLFIGVLANEAVKVSTVAAPWIQERLGSRSDIDQFIRRLPGYDLIAPYSQEIITRAGTLASNLGKAIFAKLSALTSGTISFFLHLAIMLYAMYFFFVNGEAWLKRILYFVPLKHEDEMKLLNSFRSMTRATVKGTLVVGIVQGGLAGLALAVAGIPSSLFWGTIMVFLTLIPAVGTALIWLPACVILLIKGEMLKGVLVFLWCALVVGTVDNFLRPLLIGKDTKMHELVVLISTLGGLFLFGLPGFIIGPVIASLFVTSWNIYGVLFKEALPEVKPLGNAPAEK